MPSQTTDYELRTLEIAEITVGRDNPRRIDPTSGDIKELAASIAASGVIEPVHVRRVGKGGSKGGGYELIAGERRLVAAKIADCTTVQVIDHGVIGDDEAFEITFLENFGRKDLTVMEESLAVQMCMTKFGSSAKVAEKLGKSVRWVEQRANIAKGLSDEWKKEISGKLPYSAWPASHIALIARLPRNIQAECIGDCYDDEQLTLSELEAKLACHVKLLDKAPWDMDKTGPDEKMPACKKCSKRSSVQPGLWDAPDADAANNDRCLDTDCWQKKYYAWLKGRLQELRGQYDKVICLTGEYLYRPEAGQLQAAVGGYSEASGFSVVKKQSDDRTAALIVQGKGIGEVRWVKDKVVSGGGTAAGGSSRGAPLMSVGKPKTLKKRREELKSKRWFEVLREMMDLVRKSTVDQITVDEKLKFVIAAAATFGAPKKWRRGMVDDNSCKGLAKRLEEYCLAETPEAGCLAAIEELWGMVKPKLTEAVTYNDAITRTPKDKIDDAKAIAGYLGIDIKAMFDKQKEAIKEPAGWKNLKADGTPKAAKAAKKQTTTGKKAAKKKS